MAFSLQKVKSLFGSSNRNERLAGSGSVEPEIGFKLVHNSVTKILYVTVIGARHLPSLFGLSIAKGYLVKVKLFPGDAKFETTLQENSWPVWNEEFKFQLGQKKAKKPSASDSNLVSQLSGHFISLTVYAVLDTTPPKKDGDKKKKAGKTPVLQGNYAIPVEPQSTSRIEKFQNVFMDTFRGEKKTEPTKSLAEKRRTIGAATWNFDVKLFHVDLKYDLTGTPDIWRPIDQLNSGISGADAAQENKKGQIEISVLYTSSENGMNDYITITLQKMRCNIKTMQEHEQQKAPLYIKASISDKNQESHWKSERFQPTISARWDPKSSCARLPVNAKTLSTVTVYVSLGCKNSVGVKEILGKVLIGENTPCSELWTSAIKSPGIPKSQWVAFD